MRSAIGDCLGLHHRRMLIHQPPSHHLRLTWLPPMKWIFRSDKIRRHLRGAAGFHGFENALAAKAPTSSGVRGPRPPALRAAPKVVKSSCNCIGSSKTLSSNSSAARAAPPKRHESQKGRFDVAHLTCDKDWKLGRRRTKIGQRGSAEVLAVAMQNSHNVFRSSKVQS